MNQSPGAHVNPKPAQTEVPGHFGELVQGLAGPGGPVALVTLPCPVLLTRVRFTPAPGALVTDEPISAKALAAARAALATLAPPGWGGHLAIERPCPPGLGAGTSTAEALGAIRTVAAAFGTRLDPEAEAALCVAAEGATDPLMYSGETLVFASREGRVLRRLPGLPPLRAVGGFIGEGQATDPGDAAYRDASPVFAKLEEALTAGDAGRVGRAATRSAAMNQARRPVPGFDALLTAGEAFGAHGLAVAHTGAAVAFLLPQAAAAETARAALLQHGARNVIDWHLP